MKGLKLKLIFLAGPAVLLVLGVGAVCPGSSEIALLSEAQLAALAGGSSHYCWTEVGGESDYSNCEAHECQDIGCSPCDLCSGGTCTSGYCKGNDGDDEMVENCYDTDTSSDCCTPAANQATTCSGKWWSTLSDCKNDASGSTPLMLQKQDCTSC